MLRLRSATAVAALCLFVLTSCGERPSAASTEDGPAPLSDATVERVLAQGVDPALVHTIDLPGFTLVEHSAGVVGDADYGAFYAAEPPTDPVWFEVAAGGFGGQRCRTQPLVTPSTAPLDVAECRPDGDDGWYRVGGDRHEYVLEARGHHLRLSAPTGAIDRATMRSALVGARDRAGNQPVPAPSTPVERGDLPSTGDGAPVDPCATECPGG
ncbi:hypothetical protein KUV85_17070 [Nocardioides panacisoli]|uniref:hypothetical protein n=1 Tax=Nocardioides panacisoli TaxID=627624 RepID=UPI001C632E2E|nr:hypothetical protein [Nocardioides panacisoli]QYJ04011.1 hypothetical protein KUV85_17070 [Nocardioides panacisoli]